MSTSDPVVEPFVEPVVEPVVESIVELAALPASQQAALGGQLARWHIDEFGHLYPHDVWNEQIAVAEFKAMSTVGVLPSTWVAFDGGDRSVAGVLGSVSLIATDDLPGHEHVGPWLASLFVHPRARGRGLGRRLVEHALQAARARGHDDVYLFTAGQTEYYRQRGWRVAGEASAQGHQADVMVRRTASTAARRAVCSTWATNPDVGGAYSYVRVGAHPLVRATLAGPVLPGLWLAGEHTSVGYPATMHGAWFSGERVAAQVAARPGERVLVVGAGLAGLVAARTLHDAGAVVTVVESADRLGGRAAVDTSLGVPVPLGGAWLHGDQGHPMRELVRSVPDEFGDYAATFVEHIGLLDPAATAEAEQLLYTVLGQLPLAPAEATVATIAEATLAVAPVEPQVAAAARAYLTLYMESLYAAPMNDASAHHVLEEYELPGGNHFITSSLQPVFDSLAEGLDVRLGHRVAALEHTPAGWASSTGLIADQVVVTVPIGALRARRISFQPPLPTAVVEAIDGLGAGPVCKLFATYDTAWWPLPGRAFYAIAPGSALPVSVAADISDLTGVPTLCWFAVGEAARLIETMAEDQLCRLVDDLASRCRLSA